MWDFLDKVVYINLDHRTDRQEIMKRFFEEANIPTEKVERFSAIRHSVGIVGCAMGHIAILKRAKQQGWKNVLILEDDLQWIDFETNYKKLEELVSVPNWDVCMLGGLFIKTEDVYVKMGYCTNAYIVNQHYYDAILNNFETGLQKKTSVNLPRFPVLTLQQKQETVRKIIDSRNEFNVDTYWFKLQEKDNWIGMIPPMCDQVSTYSDIYNKIVVHQTVDVPALTRYGYYLRKLMG